LFSVLKYPPVIVVLWLCGVILADGVSLAAPAVREKFIIGCNKVYQTPYYVFDSGAPGPKVLLQAGIHGDEVAGVYALEQILPKIEVTSGKLIIFPRMNPPALLSNRRYFNLDLNRLFPGSLLSNPYEYSLAREIYDLVQKEKIEYVISLHESKNFHNPARPKTFGQTIIYGIEPPPRLLWQWLQSLNKNLDYDEKFCHYYCPQEDGSTDILVKRLHLKGGFAVETWRSFDLWHRIEMQKLAVLTFLQQVGLKYSLK
jgi:uncharacterized protein